MSKKAYDQSTKHKILTELSRCGLSICTEALAGTDDLLFTAAKVKEIRFVSVELRFSPLPPH